LERKLGVGKPNLRIFIRPQEKFQSGQVNVTKFQTYYYYYIQGDQKVSVHLVSTIQKVTSNVQSVPRQSPDIY
jgi:hypothetical protein